MRMKKGAALKVLEAELERVGWDTTSAFTVNDKPRAEAGELAWWHQNTPANEMSETMRNRAYLRAYRVIAGRDQFTARGLQLDRGRLWMDRSVISRLERDNYLAFIPAPEGGFEPVFELTDKGRDWLAEDI